MSHASTPPAPRPARPPRRAATPPPRSCRPRRPAAGPRVEAPATPGADTAEGPTPAPRPSRPARRSFGALVWRRLRRSIPGMLGLILVASCSSLGLRRLRRAGGPQGAERRLRAARQDLLLRPGGRGLGGGAGWRLLPVAFPIVERDEFDPVTYQPLIGPDYANPRPSRLFAPGCPYTVPRHPARPPPLRRRRRLAAPHPRHRQASAATSSPAGSSARASRSPSRSSPSRSSPSSARWPGSPRATRRPLRRLAPALRRDHPRLPAAPPLPGARHADPGHRALRAVPDLRGPRHRRPRLGAALPRGPGKTMALRQVDYVRAAIAVGASDGRIITRHILPNVMSHVIVAITLGIPTIVLLEGFLGFLGFAVKPPLISWGLMLQDAGTFSVIGSYPWILSPVGFVLRHGLRVQRARRRPARRDRPVLRAPPMTETSPPPSAADRRAATSASPSRSRAARSRPCAT